MRLVMINDGVNARPNLDPQRITLPTGINLS